MSRHNVEKFMPSFELPDLPAEENDISGTRQTTFTAHQPASPAIGPRHSPRLPASSALRHVAKSLLPDVTRISFRIPCVHYQLHFNLDCRTFGEDVLLLGALIFAVWKFYELQTKNHVWLFTGE